MGKASRVCWATCTRRCVSSSPVMVLTPPFSEHSSANGLGRFARVLFSVNPAITTQWHEGNHPTFGSCINLWRGRLALTCLAQVQLASIQASSPEERRPLRSFVPRCRTWFCGNFVPKIVHNALWTPGSRKRLVFFFFATDDYSLLCKSGSLAVAVALCEP